MRVYSLAICYLNDWNTKTTHYKIKTTVWRASLQNLFRHIQDVIALYCHFHRIVQYSGTGYNFLLGSGVYFFLQFLVINNEHIVTLQFNSQDWIAFAIFVMFVYKEQTGAPYAMVQHQLWDFYPAEATSYFKLLKTVSIQLVLLFFSSDRSCCSDGVPRGNLQLASWIFSIQPI